MTDTTQLRQLPWNGPEGQTAYVPQGDGIVNRLADVMEAELIETARADVARALAMAADPKVSEGEMRMALRYLASSLQDAAKVADLRAARLPYEDRADNVDVLAGRVLRCLPGQADSPDRD